MGFVGKEPAEAALTSDDITDGIIVDADINASAAIAMSKTAFSAGTGITLSTNTLNVDAAQTGITSLLATDIKIGEDDQTKIDFEDANKINFYANNAKEVELAENSLSPGTSDGTALGTTSLMWSDLFLADGGVINLNNGDVLLTHSANTLTLTGGGLVVGVDDTGHDVKFFGATSGKYMEWDESADQLDVTGSFDVTGNSTMVGTLTVGVNDTGHDVKFFGATSGKYMEWDESADQLDVTGSLDVTGNTSMVGTLTIGVDDTGHDVKFFGASAGAYMEWDESADQLRIMGASADATTSTGKLLLATSLTDINANDVIGKIEFQAPHEAGGTDAIEIAAGIEAVAQGTFSSSVNSTDLVFKTGHSEAATEKFRFTSQGEIGIGGTNYGSDGQVLTSGGAGAAVAWEDAGSGDAFVLVASGTSADNAGATDIENIIWKSQHTLDEHSTYRLVVMTPDTRKASTSKPYFQTVFAKRVNASDGSTSDTYWTDSTASTTNTGGQQETDYWFKEQSSIQDDQDFEGENNGAIPYIFKTNGSNSTYNYYTNYHVIFEFGPGHYYDSTVGRIGTSGFWRASAQMFDSSGVASLGDMSGSAWSQGMFRQRGYSGNTSYLVKYTDFCGIKLSWDGAGNEGSTQTRRWFLYQHQQSI